jgi:hypothetical protein
VFRDVERELTRLAAYARSLSLLARSHPERAAIVAEGRAYLDGALATLRHVGMLTHGELMERRERIMAPLNPETRTLVDPETLSAALETSQDLIAAGVQVNLDS